jgi:hypothetical protein
MVALAAMDHGRQCMWGLHKEWLDGQDKEQTLITAFFPNRLGQLTTSLRVTKLFPVLARGQWHASGTPGLCRHSGPWHRCSCSPLTGLARGGARNASWRKQLTGIDGWPPTTPGHPFSAVDGNQGIHLQLPPGFHLPADA